MKYNNSYLLKYMNYILPFNKQFLSLGGGGSRIIKNIEILKNVHWDELKKITVGGPRISQITYSIPADNSAVGDEQIGLPKPTRVNIVTVTPRNIGVGVPGESIDFGSTTGYYFRTYDINGNQTYEEYVPVNGSSSDILPVTSNDLINAVNEALESHLPNIKQYGVMIDSGMNVTYEFTKDQEVRPSIIFKDIKDPATFDWTKLLSLELTVTENTQGVMTIYRPEQEPIIVELKQDYTLYRNEYQNLTKEQLYQYITEIFFLNVKRHLGTYVTISGSLANCIKLYLKWTNPSDLNYYTLKDFNDGVAQQSLNYSKIAYLELVPFEITSDDVHGDDFVRIDFDGIKFEIGGSGDWIEEENSYSKQLSYCWSNTGNDWDSQNCTFNSTFKDFTYKLNQGYFGDENPRENLIEGEILEFSQEAALESLANKILNNFRVYYTD